MNIYIQEVKSLFRNMIIWAVSLSLLIVLFLMLYPGLAKDADQFKAVLSNYPPQVLKALGASIDLVTSLNGFYSYCFVYLNLCVAIQGMFYGVLVLSKETARKTCDFIFAKPAKRVNILASKFAAILTCLLITDAVIIFAAVICALSVKTSDFDVKVFVLISLTMVITQLIFASLGFLCAALIKKIKSPAGFALGIVMAFFGLSMIQNVLDDEKLKYISFLTYFKGEYIIRHGHYELSMAICAAAVIAIFIAAAFVYYSKKDIHSA